ncbi:DUF2057 family protein [Motilimonas pumila]|nr:DUF2057 family protein [Motilimonas pumila]
MLKKILIVSLSASLMACAANPNSTSSEEFAKETQIDIGYNAVRVQGTKVQAKPTSEAGAKVTAAQYYITTSFSKTSPAESDAIVHMELSYFQTTSEFEDYRVDGIRGKVTAQKVTSQMCNDNCMNNQWFEFPIPTATLVAAKDTGLPFEILVSGAEKGLEFEVPAAYIQGLVKRYQKAQQDYNVGGGEIASSAPAAAPVATTAVAATSAGAITRANSDFSTEAQMLQHWFNKVTPAEQEAFIDWALKNRKAIKGQAKPGSKGYDMLTYWFTEANVSERSEIISWAVENMK